MPNRGFFDEGAAPLDLIDDLPSSGDLRAERDCYRKALERIAKGHTQGTSSRGVDELMAVAQEALDAP